MKRERDNLVENIINSKEYKDLLLEENSNKDSYIVERGDEDYVFSKDLFDLDENMLSVMENVYNLDVLSHKHDFFEIQYVYSGCVVQEINGERVELPKGTLTLFNKNVAHTLQKGSADDRLFHIGINDAIFSQGFFSLVVPKNRLASYIYRSLHMDQKSNDYIMVRCDDEEIVSLIENMQKEYLHRREGFEKNLLMYLIILFNKYHQLYSNTDANPIEGTFQERIQQIRVAISERYKDITLGDLADEIHVHPNYLSKFIAENMGTTFNELVTDARLKKATYLLVATSLSVEAISNDVGYTNVNYFYKTFKKHLGSTPNQYRKSNRKV